MSKLIDDSSGAEGHGAPSLPQHQDAFNRKASRAVSAQDISQRLVVSTIYELPIGKGKALGGRMPSWLNVGLGNWQVNGIVTLSGGYPLAFSAANNAGIFNAVQRPNLVGNPAFEENRTTSERLLRYFNTAAFAQPAAFTLGNLSRTTDAVRSDGLANVDFALFKRFPFHLFGKEEQRIEFRAEAFNLFNSPQFGFPGTTLGQAGFGVIGTQANLPRQVQLGLKFVF
jgi:hypothetical protein